MGYLQSGTALRLDSFDEQWTSAEIELEATHHLDEGASGKIFLATMRQGPSTGGDSMRIALKVFPAELSDTKRELLRRELRASRSLKHLHIIPFMGTATHGPQTIIVMPYMRNGNLLQYMANQTKVGFRWLVECSRMIAEVADAVNYLHDSARYIHGDIKCRNVLVSDEGKALLADFGLSTSIEKEEDEDMTSTRIRTQTTLRFCAPELFWLDDLRLGRRSKTRATDVYAFGMLILEAFTQEMPWAGLTNRQVMLALAKQQMPKRPRNAPALNDFLWYICKRCWMINPAERPPMIHIARALQLNTQLIADGLWPGLQTLPQDVVQLMFEMDVNEWQQSWIFHAADHPAMSRQALIQAVRTAGRRFRTLGAPQGVQWTRDDFPTLQEAYGHLFNTGNLKTTGGSRKSGSTTAPPPKPISFWGTSHELRSYGSYTAPWDLCQGWVTSFVQPSLRTMPTGSPSVVWDYDQPVSQSVM
ncbi:kinase-like protein [Exidia glandulosa HHB12029]|uniref:Kinase-like protein n=1 Tax=Exidia glandulosa HHB12029 TaxID=1314781 RepID=A0A165MLH3_EXIGL|nr:kinase-like protein [Exidia glandulosa HHB12029]